MIEISSVSNEKIVLKNADKKEIFFDFSQGKVFMEDYDVTYPWEYEKGGNLLEVKEYANILFYKFLVDGYHVCFVCSDSFDLSEEILWFFGDVDILIIVGTKDAVKVFENIEAKVVIPYGEGKDVFLNTAGQHPEPVSVYKVKGELEGENTEFVNLEG